MIISIASGKGGTGKTTVAVNLALSLGDVQLLDCDVEEPDAHIFLKPKIEQEIPAIIPVPGWIRQNVPTAANVARFANSMPLWW